MPITTALYIFRLDVGELESITSFFWSEESGSSLMCKCPVNDVSVCHTAQLVGIEAIESGVNGAMYIQKSSNSSLMISGVLLHCTPVH
jgi:hypothetical protein